MDLSPELFDEIDAYLRNRMMPEDRTRFKQRMAENNALRQEVALQQQLHAGLDAASQRQQHGEAGSETAAIRQQFAQVRFERHQQHRQQQRAYAIAASVALLLISFLVVFINRLNRSAAELAFANYYQPEPRMRSDTLIPAGLEAAQNEYYAGHYEQALAQLNTRSDDSAFRISYYRGLAQLALNKTVEASANFEIAQWSADRIIQRRAEWYLSLTLLRANEPVRAIPILRRIADNPRQPYREQAGQILQDLP